MVTKTMKPIRGRRLRATRLDGCARPVFGGDSVAVSKAFVSVGFTANTVDTDEINLPNAAGERCLYDPGSTTLSGYTLEIAFCEVDPEFFSIVTGNPVVEDEAGNVIGFDIDTDLDLSAQAFALEVWTDISGGDACATDAAGSWGYLLLPFLKGGIVGDFTVENDAVTFTLSGATTRTGNQWGRGPYNVVLNGGIPSPFTTPLKPSVPLRVITVGVAPPEPTAGARPLLDPTATPITAIAKTNTAGSLSVAFTTTPADIAESVWYDFGDGDWDYTSPADLGDTTHVYDEPGTYTVRASTNGTWVTLPVTVTGT